MKLKEIKGNMAIHFNDRSQLKILKDNGFLDDGFHVAGNATWLRFKDGICTGWMPERSDFGKATKKCYEEEGITCMEFSDLIIPELTAAEVLRTIQEICKNYSCFACPLEFNSECMIGAEGIDKNAVIEICEKWKSDHETKKKEPEVEWVWETCIFGSHDHSALVSEEEAIKWCEQFVKEHPDERCFYRHICRVKR